jgi:inward rectifier potassium channel
MRAPRRSRRVGLTEGAVSAVGLRRRPLSDVYHFLLNSRWSVLLPLIAGSYAAANAAFALAYLALGDVIEHARPGSFADAFFFSVQTMATVGYGNLWPRGTAANVLATIEMIAGGMGLALMTGLVFAKFARPTARVLFSKVAVLRSWEGAPVLQFRMANERSSQIVEAHVSVMLVKTERTREGDVVRRLHDLVLLRSQHALFALTWTAIHRIDRSSPLHGADPESLAAEDAIVVVSFSGFDENLAATVHARHTYLARDLRFGRRFVDVVIRGPGGERMIDYRRFHETEPEGAASTS